MSTTPDQQLRHPLSEHHLEWNDRLQDWLDGDLEAAEAPEFEAHLASCAICQERLGDFEQLETQLHQAAPTLALDSSFDARIFSQIESVDEAQRAAARQRIEQELQNNLRKLSQGWRRTLAFVIPGIAAGVALAFALTSYFDASGLTGRLVAESAGQLGAGSASWVHAVLTTALGASIGGLMAGWMAKSAA
ncbi:MAG TPA: zf-HC2 domain-containing protein [Povalibacter sp.]|nr:zf-HC2 domain-containing protein [Povalibacter sp.]